MAKTAIALIVAGSGDADIEEITDLLNDAYPEDKVELDLMVPVSKPYYTDAVANAVEWFSDDENVYALKVGDGNMSRASAAIGSGDATEVEKFEDLFKPEDFTDWDETHVILALPTDEGSADYDLYAGIAEAAIDAGFTVKNLSQALDDVTIEDEPEPEKDPEPEKPVRRRRKAAEPEAEEPKDEPADEPEPEEKPARTSRKKDVLDAVQEEPQVEQPAAVSKGEFIVPPEALENLAQVVRFLEKNDEMFALRNLADEVIYAPITKAAQRVWKALTESTEGEPAKGADEPQSADDGPKRGRGRPRTNFEVKEIYDEDAEDGPGWVPRPKGRVKKGTKWRVRHSESNEILDEGTV